MACERGPIGIRRTEPRSILRITNRVVGEPRLEGGIIAQKVTPPIESRRVFKPATAIPGGRRDYNVGYDF